MFDDNSRDEEIGHPESAEVVWTIAKTIEYQMCSSQQKRDRRMRNHGGKNRITKFVKSDDVCVGIR